MKEQKTLAFFDCDGTLIHTELPDTGKQKWAAHYGKPYPHLGWWGREESLDLTIFENKPHDFVHGEYLKIANDPAYLKFILTSRMPKLRNHLQAILDKHGIVMQEILCAEGKLTKGDRINRMIETHQAHYDIVEVIMYEDRNKEIATIEPYRSQWEQQGIKLTIHKIESDARD